MFYFTESLCIAFVAHLCVSPIVYVRACVRACVHVYVRFCMHACGCACVCIISDLDPLCIIRQYCRVSYRKAEVASKLISADHKSHSFIEEVYDLTRLPSKAKAQMASGQGSHWLLILYQELFAYDD